MIQVLSARENVKKPAVYECTPGAVTEPPTSRNLTNYDVRVKTSFRALARLPGLLTF